MFTEIPIRVGCCIPEEGWLDNPEVVDEKLRELKKNSFQGKVSEIFDIVIYEFRSDIVLCQ